MVMIASLSYALASCRDRAARNRRLMAGKDPFH
jgi:hypothetical protein